MDPSAHWSFLRRLFATVLVALLLLLVWRLKSVIVLIFAAMLLALLLSATADFITRRTKLPRKLALACSVLLFVGVIAGILWLFGSQLSTEATAIANSLPQAIAKLDGQLQAHGVAPLAVKAIETSVAQYGSVARIAGFALTTASTLIGILVVLVGGIYIAAQPGLYRTGLIKLVPPARRALAEKALDDVTRALRLWLVGQIAAMAIVGAMTGIGLWILGLPSPLALGLLAAALEFIPYLGPILSAVPAVLLTLARDPHQALVAVALYIVVHQLENHLIQPLVQQRAIAIPPAVLLFGVLAGGSLFGLQGVIIAAPLAVTCYVLIKRLYVREALHTPTPLP